MQPVNSIYIESLLIRDITFVPNSTLLIFGGSDRILYFYDHVTCQ